MRATYLTVKDSPRFYHRVKAQTPADICQPLTRPTTKNFARKPQRFPNAKFNMFNQDTNLELEGIPPKKLGCASFRRGSKEDEKIRR